MLQICKYGIVPCSSLSLTQCTEHECTVESTADCGYEGHWVSKYRVWPSCVTLVCIQEVSSTVSWISFPTLLLSHSQSSSCSFVIPYKYCKHCKENIPGTKALECYSGCLQMKAVSSPTLSLHDTNIYSMVSAWVAHFSWCKAKGNSALLLIPFWQLWPRCWWFTPPPTAPCLHMVTSGISHHMLLKYKVHILKRLVRFFVLLITFKKWYTRSKSGMRVWVCTRCQAVVPYRSSSILSVKTNIIMPSTLILSVAIQEEDLSLTEGVSIEFSSSQNMYQPPSRFHLHRFYKYCQLNLGLLKLLNKCV